jgi:DNA-binding transcriptional LysR family regulator
VGKTRRLECGVRVSIDHMHDGREALIRISAFRRRRYQILYIAAVFAKIVGGGGAMREGFLSDDYDLIKRMAIDTDHVARGPRFVFEPEFSRGDLVEVELDSDFQYECWMLTTSASWRSPIIKAIAQFSKEA